MKKSILAISMMSFIGLNGPAMGAVKPKGGSNQVVDQQDYDFSGEVIKAVLGSVDQSGFNVFVLDFDGALSMEDSTKPPIINSLKVAGSLSFKPNPEGITIPLMKPNPQATETEKTWAPRIHLNLSKRLLVFKMEGPGDSNEFNEFKGKMYFYTISPDGKNFIPDAIEVAGTTNNSVLRIKKLWIKGFDIKVKLNVSDLTKLEMKKGLFEAFVNCNAQSAYMDPRTRQESRVDVEKCTVSFDGDMIVPKIKEKLPSYLPAF